MHMMMNTDADKVAGAKLNRRTARRVLGFARPYRGAIIAFVVVIVLESVLALVPIFVFKRIIDVAIPEGDRGMLHLLAGRRPDRRGRHRRALLHRALLLLAHR